MRRPSMTVSFLPVLFLLGLLVINIILFGDEATGGANQLALLIASAFTIVIGHFYLKIDYKEIEKKVLDSVGVSLQALLILLVVGTLISIWILSGIVPTMIYYGLKLIHPSVFLAVSCLVCALVSLATGSSWSTTGTIGVALMAIGEAMGISEGMIAGAIISGAYFGDKMSPLSDTTNLAPAMAGTDLFTHIRHMMYTSGPAIVISLILFSIIGFFQNASNTESAQIASVLTGLEANFTITPLLFVVPAVVVFLVYKKTSALPALFVGIFGAVILTFIFQIQVIHKFGGTNVHDIVKYVLEVAISGFEMNSGGEILNKLLSRGGMYSMLKTVWLIFCAMIFGGALDATGMLETISTKILQSVRSVGGLVGSTLASCLFFNMTACDQYLAIVVPGKMFKKSYDKFNLHPKNLSRALEDAGTVTSVLVPWNTGGAYNSGVLGVSTLTYLPFCFFNILSPIISAFLGAMGWTIVKKIEAKENYEY
ncbi:Na+/H+ antiporter NhaC [Halobacteriovorax sp. GB3]|uniref:Na+/H+ antiporter NhaC n=1 Tax=Halobacteriovorax sp. GB3 TaxID=2719615 RepID=UPI00235E3B4E|nr:Na+/H+ antiporter NhaC [Halobacteriovorax sp. GB3]MDD0851524.1 Na+/H+ antiporter NhaC [Halobacteriovorax sp. GB3]